MIGSGDYISREAAIESVKKEREYTGKYSFEEEHAWAVGFHQGITFALSDIASIPAADVRPVVTCGECQHNNACMTQAFVDDCGKIPLDRNTFFCADGERKNNA